jgi:N-acetylmuramoyl-L-alanine amidase
MHQTSNRRIIDRLSPAGASPRTVSLLGVAALVGVLLAATVLAACSRGRTGHEAYKRNGDEIMIAGRLFHTGAPVVLWTDPNGYDAYRVERRFVPFEESSWEATAKGGRGPSTPNRYNLRNPGLSSEEIEQVRGGGWDLASLRGVVDQFMIHYDVCGTSRQCFRVLHDMRGLSIHFMLDIDGTIYQTLDVKERAWHATSSNHRSVGIEIANIGAYPPGQGAILKRWYEIDEEGRAKRITIPSTLGDGGVRTPGFVGRPARAEPVVGEIHGKTYEMYDLTPEQYDSLIKLTAALCTALPNIRCDYPRGPDGHLLTTTLEGDALRDYRGLLGHFHIQKDKIDPGPAFDWDRVVTGARRLMNR